MSDNEQEFENDQETQEEETQQEETQEEETQGQVGFDADVQADETESAGHKPVQRNQSKQSMGGSHRSTAAVEFEDEEREQSHLKEHNVKLQEQVKALKKTIRGLKEGAGGDISPANGQTIETLNAESESYQADINTYKEKAKKVNNIELLDTLIDDLANRKLQMKGLELEKRQLGDAKRANMKALHSNEDSPSRQKVFLELKDERRRQNIRLNAAQERKEKLADQIKLIQAKAEDAMAKAEDLGLTDVNVPSVINMRKKDEEQVKQIQKLRSQKAAINSSFGTMKTRTNWSGRDKEVILEDMRAELAKIKEQITAKEQLIMSNQGTNERPPHFVQPLADKGPTRSPRRAQTKSGTNPSSKPLKKDDSKALTPTPPPKSLTPPPGDDDADNSFNKQDSQDSPAQGGGAGGGGAQLESAEYSDDYNSPSPQKKDGGGEEEDDEYKDDEDV